MGQFESQTVLFTTDVPPERRAMARDSIGLTTCPDSRYPAWPYEIASLIGSGGMREVYQAHDGRPKRTFAIKRLIYEQVDAIRRLRLRARYVTTSSLKRRCPMMTVFRSRMPASPRRSHECRALDADGVRWLKQDSPTEVRHSRSAHVRRGASVSTSSILRVMPSTVNVRLSCIMLRGAQDVSK